MVPGSFENDDGSVRGAPGPSAGDRPSVGETYAYDMVRFGIERDGVVECITDQDALAYDFGHHNWSCLRPRPRAARRTS
ncbi:MAG: hypothetical protein IPI43_13350 [Sandaracinaceae bacterium]|nr:hypothetical protein [Sandaracinaceae bacterium]